MNKLIRFIIAAAFTSIVEAGPVSLIKVSPEMQSWNKERDLIVDAYRTDFAPPKEMKILPLFICVRLGLCNPVSDCGATIHEYAFVYTEIEKENKVMESKVVIFVREPYRARKWRTEEWYNVTDAPGSRSSILTLGESKRKLDDISEHVRQFTNPTRAGSYIISMVVFGAAVSKVFPDGVEDDKLANMCAHDYLDFPK